MDWLLTLFRVKVVVRGEEKLPDEPAVFVSNHISDFDPMAVLAVLRRDIIYISKESNFKLPIVGRFLRRTGFFGDRPRKSHACHANAQACFGIDARRSR